jgi:hypothetical protein
MSERVEINIFRFTSWSDEVFDPEMDVRGEKLFGFYTWRTTSQPNLATASLILPHATFQQLADIDMFARSIQDFFTWKVREAEAKRIATAVVAKISHAMTTTAPETPLKYVHSKRYFQSLTELDRIRISQ